MIHEKLKIIYERNKILREPRRKSYYRRKVNKGTYEGWIKTNPLKRIEYAPAIIYSNALELYSWYFIDNLSLRFSCYKKFYASRISISLHKNLLNFSRIIFVSVAASPWHMQKTVRIVRSGDLLRIGGCRTDSEIIANTVGFSGHV